MLGADPTGLAPAPAPAPEAGACPLTPTQAGLLFHSDLAPGDGVYTQQLALEIPEQLDPGLLQEAFQRVLARHDLFRTCFPADASGTRRQLVREGVELPWTLQDWRSFGATDREAAWQRLLDEDRGRGWDFARAPLMRCTLARLEERRWRLLWSHHHALVDGRSTVLAIVELARIHRALRAREPLALPPPAPFCEYVRWLEARDAAADAAYWRETLGGFTEALEVGEARRDEPFRHLTQTFPLGPALSAQAAAFVEAGGLTLNTLVMGAWALLLSRVTGREDVLFGTTLSTGWPRMQEGRAVAGLFVTSLPLRVPVEPDAEVLPWLRALRARWRELRRHERTPLIEAQRCSGVPAGRPLLTTLAMFDRASVEEGVARGLPAGCPWSARLHETLDTPLALAAFGTGEVSVRLGCDSRLFRPEEIARLGGHLRTLLDGLSGGAARRLRDVPSLTADERRTMLSEWNARPCEFPREACVHQLFEARARAAPDAPAAVFEGRRLTYGQLDARAQLLADSLRAWGVGPEVLVGVAAERSLEMLVGVLAVLKAGGAFVPLNPDDPPARLASMLEQAPVPVLLAQERLLPTLPAGSRRVFCLDRDWPTLRPPAAPLPPAPVGPRNLAYVIFTSGSTGRPKGVMVEHRNVVAFLHGYREVTGDTEGRVGTNVAPFSFDTSVEEIWSCLCFGGTVHVVRPELSTDGAGFARYLVEHGVTTAYVAPDNLAGVATHLAADAGRLRLRCLITGLHPKKERALQPFRDLAPGLRILNAYGPTETTYGATAFAFDRAADPNRDVPIGVPFPGYQAYVVDTRLEPVPVGVAGELVVGGVGVARGYLGQPEATARAFVPDPWGPVPGGRLYRTGDRCRFRADGVIEFLGRTDQQVKIRGYRVELGEVETALARLPGVRECAAAAVPDPRGGLRLVAYLAGGPFATPTELRALLATSLPHYMVPSAFVPLAALPRTSAGKLDRRSLPAPGPVGQEETRGVHDPPRTASERLLAGLWQEVLSAAQVGRGDDFFDLGGDSLHAFRLVALLGSRAGIELPVKAVFETPTLAALAARMAAGPAAAPPVAEELRARQMQYLRTWKGDRRVPDAPVVTLNGAGRRQGLFWCLQGFRELEQLARHLGPDRPVHGMRSGHLVMEYTAANLAALASWYADELVAIQPEGPFLLGGNCQGGTVAFAVARRLGALGRCVGLLVLMEEQAFLPYDGPVALVFGRGSTLNPYRPGADPEAVFRAAYPAGFTVDIVGGGHGEFFESPNVETLAAALERRLP